MKTLREIRPTKQAAEADLLKRAGVTGVDIGYKYVGGKKTDELSIRVYVAEKKAKEDVPKKEIIPKTMEGVKTDVIQRKFVLHPLRLRLADLEVKADTGTYDPLKGGISIGPCRVIDGYIYTGTLGAIVKDNDSGDPMLLSNFHVMCVDDAWSAGDTMAQPSRVDGGHCPADVVGELQRASLGGQVDCAVASLTARGYACEIEEIGKVTGTATATPDMAVRKRGRTTGLTYGTVDTVDLTVQIDYGDGLGVVVLTDQIGIDVDPAQSAKFGISGDSGSVVVNDKGKVVGLYFAGNMEEVDENGNIVTPEGVYGVANPIQAVLDALNVSICVPPPPICPPWAPRPFGPCVPYAPRPFGPCVPYAPRPFEPCRPWAPRPILCAPGTPRPQQACPGGGPRPIVACPGGGPRPIVACPGGGPRPLVACPGGGPRPLPICPGGGARPAVTPPIPPRPNVGMYAEAAWYDPYGYYANVPPAHYGAYYPEEWYWYAEPYYGCENWAEAWSAYDPYQTSGYAPGEWGEYDPAAEYEDWTREDWSGFDPWYGQR